MHSRTVWQCNILSSSHTAVLPQGSLKKPLDEGMYAQGSYREASPSASPGGSLRGGQAFGPPLESPRRSARSAPKDTCVA